MGRACLALVTVTLLGACGDQPARAPTHVTIDLEGAAPPCDYVVWANAPHVASVVDAVRAKREDLSRLEEAAFGHKRRIARRPPTTEVGAVSDDGRFWASDIGWFHVVDGSPAEIAHMPLRDCPPEPPGKPPPEDFQTKVLQRIKDHRRPDFWLCEWRIDGTSSDGSWHDQARNVRTKDTIDVDGAILAISADSRTLAIARKRDGIVFVRDGRALYQIAVHYSPTQHDLDTTHVELSPSGRYAVWNDDSGTIGALDLQLGIQYGGQEPR